MLFNEVRSSASKKTFPVPSGNGASQSTAFTSGIGTNDVNKLGSRTRSGAPPQMQHRLGGHYDTQDSAMKDGDEDEDSDEDIDMVIENDPVLAAYAANRVASERMLNCQPKLKQQVKNATPNPKKKRGNSYNDDGDDDYDMQDVVEDDPLCPRLKPNWIRVKAQGEDLARGPYFYEN